MKNYQKLENIDLNFVNHLDNKTKFFRFLFYLLLFLLVFEGITRKFLPGSLSNILFFFKDFICVFIVFQFAIKKLSVNSNYILRKWKILSILFFPLFFIHSFYDPILILWGGKLYLLYVALAILTIEAFNSLEAFKRLYFIVSILVVATTCFAVIQQSLPHSHWINLSVTGDSLEHFSSAGELRLSSTFSFAGQYAYFLNFSGCFVIGGMFLDIQRGFKLFGGYNLLLKIIVIISLIIGVFITGGRAAVLGVAATAVIGLMLSLIKYRAYVIKKTFAPILLGIILVAVAQVVKPEYFKAYNKRAQGYNGVSNSQEMQNRIFGAYEDGFNEIAKENSFVDLFFGKGIGVMTNGADKVSNYANKIRSKVAWTETDFYTTSWEGGLYLIILWYAFRIAIIFKCFGVWRSLKFKKFTLAGSFLLAYILVTGLIGSLSIQPPLSIYWWISIGLIFVIKYLDNQLIKKEIAL
ncbi:hypothetical protein [Leeuwenhoekiella sp. MAR_2009_132]|uniref:hypothetical protein n=1 Tax=Leeuwenhoekiella sp. MAR_2009_132 TaxID=1392489 RepID=UPI00048C8752|nr:hypothetical protein [Leeuwenhoekiella sp. MAR_2009_132]